MPQATGDVDDRESYAPVGVKRLQELSVPSSQFCCEPKAALKNSLNFFKIL